MGAALVTFGCGGASAPAPAPRKIVVDRAPLPAKDAPIEEIETEPVVACSDPPGTVSIEGMVALDPDLGERGWIRIEGLVFRAGCVGPTYLESQLEERELALRDCFHQASRGRFSATLRLEWDELDGMVELRATSATIPAHDEPDGPSVDEERLLPCAARALAGIHLRDAALPVIVDVELVRGVPVEGATGTARGPR
jgi:hypothetical protein